VEDVDPNEEFRRLLANTDWSPQQAAEELRTTPATISRYRSGKMKPRWQVIAHLAHLTHQVARFPNGLDYSAMNEEPRHLEEWERRLLDVIRRVSPQRRRKVVESVITTIEAHDPPPVTFGAKPTSGPDPGNVDPAAEAQRILDRAKKKHGGEGKGGTTQ